jgi:hypothetical protein
MSGAAAFDTQHVVGYALNTKPDSRQSHRTRKFATLEIVAEGKSNTTAADDTLDKLEQEIDTLFEDWGYDGLIYVVQRCWRDGEAVPTFDATNQGYTGRSWLYSLEFDEK